MESINKLIIPIVYGEFSFMLVAHRKDALMKIGGWNEDFIGWGGEDDYQTMKVKHFLKWVELKSRCYHLYHERVAPDNRFYQRTLQLLEKSSKMSKEELERVTNASIPKIGMKNKYEHLAI